MRTFFSGLLQRLDLPRFSINSVDDMKTSCKYCEDNPHHLTGNDALNESIKVLLGQIPVMDPDIPLKETGTLLEMTGSLCCHQSFETMSSTEQPQNGDGVHGSGVPSFRSRSTFFTVMTRPPSWSS